MRDITGHLEWTLSWGWAPRVGLFVLATVILVLAWLNVRHMESERQRATLLALRGALVLSLLIVSLQPTWVEERERERERVVAVIIDDSRSMAQQERQSRARRWARSLRSKPNTRLFAAGERLRRIDSAGRLRARDGHTDLIGALRDVGERVDPSSLAAVVVVSDGIDPQLRSGLSTEAREHVATLAVPIHTVALRDERPLTDIAIEAVRASPFAFARNRLPVEVDLALDGLSERQGHITVHASLDGVPVTSRRVALRGKRTRTIELEVQPKTLGGHVLTVTATSLPDEVTHVNNRLHRPLQVIRDRVRVLHLAGHPSYDTRFLRAHLRADPSVDLISFYIMVGRGGGVFVDSSETTLIPFPTEQLFGPALEDFDLIIFSDFDFSRFGIERFLPQTRRWLEDGGAFAVFGGPQALSAGGYGRSSMARWLPIRLDGSRGARAWQPGVFIPTRTAIGKNHAITRLKDDRSEDSALWKSLRLEGRNSSGRARANAAVLIESPDGTPVLSIAEVGKGRVAVLGTDSLWTWAYPDGATEARDAVRAAYQRLVGRLRGWLLQDPAFASLRIDTTNDLGLPHQAMPVSVQIGTTDQRANKGVPLRLSAVALPITPNSAPREIAVAKTDGTGRAQFVWRPPHGGPWRLTVSGELQGRTRHAQTAVAIADAPPEDLLIRATPNRLAALSAATGGERWTTEPNQISTARDDGPIFRERRRIDVWSRPWVAGLLFALLIGEWVLRRRWGLA